MHVAYRVILLYLSILILSSLSWTPHVQIVAITLLAPIITLVAILWKQKIDIDTITKLARFFFIGMFKTSAISLLFQGFLSMVFFLICFNNQFKDILDSIRSHENASNPLEYFSLCKSTGYYVYIFCMSFFSAGMVEETLKLTFLIRGFKELYKEKDFFSNDIRYTVMICSASLSMGFSTAESILYNFSSSSFSFSHALVRCLISLPFHICCGLLSSLRWISTFWQVMSVNDIYRVLIPSVLLHGLYDFITYLLHPLPTVNNDDLDLTSISAIFVYIFIFTLILALLIFEWNTTSIQSINKRIRIASCSYNNGINLFDKTSFIHKTKKHKHVISQNPSDPDPITTADCTMNSVTNSSSIAGSLDCINNTGVNNNINNNTVSNNTNKNNTVSNNTNNNHNNLSPVTPVTPLYIEDITL
ncbi:hypothetical protein WA158_003633 [Blastocystis sp. Blastoise]